MQKTPRLKRELEMMVNSPPPGISCFPREDSVDILDAKIIGTEGSPYESGVFELEINIPDRYPFEPPRLRFVTPVYHPNVDGAGRICLDLLRVPPAGSWRPTINISGILTAIQLLMTQPNPDDPLMAEIADEFKFNRPEFNRKAKEWTKKYAVQHLDTCKSNAQRESKSEQSKRKSNEDSGNYEDPTIESKRWRNGT